MKEHKKIKYNSLLSTNLCLLSNIYAYLKKLFSVLKTACDVSLRLQLASSEDWTQKRFILTAGANKLMSPLLHGNTTLKLIQIFGNDNKILSSKNMLVKHYFWINSTIYIFLDRSY